MVVLALVMHPGSPDAQLFALPLGTVTIGRTKDNEIHCVHKSLSRKHAQLDSDGVIARVTDLGSKNGLFYRGERVGQVELREGDTFRCGDVSFLLEDPDRKTPPRILANNNLQTLPSPLAMDAMVQSRRSTRTLPSSSESSGEDATRYKDKLFALIRASELLAGVTVEERFLEELAGLVAQVLDIDRLAILTKNASGALVLRIEKNYGDVARTTPFSRRVVESVMARGSGSSFTDVTRDDMLEGDAAEDAGIHAAVCVPISLENRSFGAIYADNLTSPNVIRADDLAFVRAIANLAASRLARG